MFMNKSSLLKSFSVLAVAALFGGSLISCSGDGDSYAPTPKITDKDGNTVQVTSAGGLSFNYDESGKLLSMSNGKKTYVLKDGKFAFDVNEGNRASKVDVYLNSDGLISKIEGTLEYSEDDEYEKDEFTLEYSYDSRRLKDCELSGKGSAEHKSSGHSYSYKGSGNVKYDWKDGNLMKVNVDTKSNYKEDGDSFDEDVTIVYDYTYGTQSNLSNQLPYYMGYVITGTEDFGGLFSVLGLFGYGPAYLPTGYTETEIEIEDGKERKHTNNRSLSFVMNDNGTIKSESMGNNRFVYTYTPTRAEEVNTQEFMQYLLNMRSIIFKHRK